MEMTKQYRLVKMDEKVRLVPRYKPTGKSPDYTGFKAKRMIDRELGQMAWEVKQSTAGSSTLIADEHGRFTHRAFSKSTFPSYVQSSGAGSTKEFLKILSTKKGLRYGRLRDTAIDRLEKGYQNDHGYDEPSKDFLVASRQLYDNKNVVFRRVRGRIIPLRIPYEKRADLVPF